MTRVLNNNYLKRVIFIVRLREMYRNSMKILSVVRYIDILKQNKQFSTKIAVIQTNWK
ncbi:hypothetical protein Bccel_5182 [Pseudobacteroides cellulosolvens ATCC 35603 = DSM 2933]|uniref:Uncharacterized protein n=1 Tax=Pseudobacteroides cellulosolvens ATCC 35603 = DSM 2933 TaxID=398512 RepID=A0A0L6JWB0_9FIRM|nr:hypothetical protein Bccel_5182 [Pseudobacteroides cellulosolvens ATCC 35603 = DSM 2933]